MKEKVYFEVVSHLGKKIRVTKDYWSFVVDVKHPPVKGLEEETKQTLKKPIEIRRSKDDKKIYLYYSKYKKYMLCVVCKHLNGDGHIITVYLADKIKEGESIWKKT